DVFGIAAGFYTTRSAVWSGPDSGLQEASGERIYISASDPAYLQAVRAVLAERKKHAELYDRPLPKNVWDPLLRLLRKALTGEDVSFAEDADWEGVFLVARDQGIAALLYSALPDSGPSADLLEKWKRAYASAIRKDLLFARMWEGLKRDLAEAEISFLPLKGMVLRDLYPVPGMREFSDYDLLYDPLKGDALEEIMNARGFRTVSREGVHDVYQKDPVYNFEFHKELFSDACPWRKAFESERVWETAVPEDGSAFRMPGPVFYAYFIAHTWKHFESAGCGLRPFADLFLLQTKTGFLSDADRELGSELLDRAGLRNAERILLDQADVLFRKDLSDVSYPQVRYCLESGVNGTVSNALRNRISDSGKAGYLLGRLFLPYRAMCELYPVLRTCPVLLPFCWVARWTGCLFRKEKRARAASELRILREKPQEWKKENE
ncbi:MAG: nucleotidyltransferase family protein, partial [Clostridia bacterium]|nr:nucleotidyltransferase family protein [Clostridia bacterium]